MSERDWEQRKAGGESSGQEEAGGQAAHPLQQLHPDPSASRSLYRRAVQRRAAAKASAPAAAPAVVQRKEDDAKDGAQARGGAEAPSAGQVGSATIAALQSHMKLTAARMYAVAANMHTIVASPANTEAGVEPLMQGLQHQYDAVMGDLSRLEGEISRVPELMRGALAVELGLLRGAWYDNSGLNRALSSVYSFTHDKDGNPRTDAGSFTGSVSAVQRQLAAIYAAAHVDEGDISNRYLARGTDVASALGEAANAAFDSGVYAIQICVRRLKADLDSMDDKDANVTAADLLAAVSATAGASRAINAKNLGSVKKTVHDVEAFQADLAKRSGPKIEKLARQIGYNSNVSVNLHALHQRMDEVAKESKHR